jgi:DNA-binding LacI/PurR family transcriptional regulator
MATTIKDISRASGFGVGTVSRVLNGSPQVRSETRERVLQVARQLRYKPNKLAKMLVTGRYSQSVIGIILPLLTHRYSLEVMGGIYSRLNELGYSLLIFNAGNNREVMFENIRTSHFSGLLALKDPLNENEKQILRDHYSHFIYLDYHEEDENSIFFDNHKGGGLAASYLVKRGCRNIVFIGDQTRSQQRCERLQGFIDGLDAYGVTPREEKFIPIDENESYQVTKNLIETGKTDGIFFYSDDLAVGGLRAKREREKDICIIGYDDIEAAGYLGLSTVRQDASTLGRLGAQKLVELLQSEHPGENLESISVCLEPELIDRGS